MERYYILVVILVGILFLLFSFLTAIYIGYIIIWIFLCRGEGMGCWEGYSSSYLVMAVELLWAMISLMFIILKLKSFNKSFLKSLYIFIPAVIVIIYIGLSPSNLINDFPDYFLETCAVSILGCIILGFLLSWLLPSQKEGITQNPVDQ